VPRKISQAKLAKMAQQAAALLGQSVEEVSQQIQESYTNRDKLIEANSVALYYEWRKDQLERKKDETQSAYTTRLRKWTYKLCTHCGLEFSYSHRYDDVGFCSLDCVSRHLATVGIKFDYARPLELRWGYQNHPAIVPAPALKAVEESLSATYGSAYESPDLSSLPKSQTA
jgi:hypothetical protein